MAQRVKQYEGKTMILTPKFVEMILLACCSSLPEGMGEKNDKSATGGNLVTGPGVFVVVTCDIRELV